MTCFTELWYNSVLSEVSIYSPFDIRLRAVGAVERGIPRVQVASAYGIDRSTLYRWLENYHQEGVAGLYRSEGSGRPKLLNELTEEELRTIVLTSAQSYGFESDLWTVGRLHRIITEKFQVFVSKHTISVDVIEFLHQMLLHHSRRHLVVIMDRATPHTSQVTQNLSRVNNAFMYFIFLPIHQLGIQMKKFGII